VDSLVELIFTESSRQKKAVLLQNGETSNLQMQHKMIQMEPNHFFRKIPKKKQYFYRKTAKKVSHSYECDTFLVGMRHLNREKMPLLSWKFTIFAT